MASKNTKKTPSEQKKNEKRKPKRSVASTSANRSSQLLWAVILFFFTLFSMIGWFSENALLIRLLIHCERGILGYGAYAVPAVLLWLGLILINENENKSKYRIVMALLLPVFLGALFFSFDYVSLDWENNPVKLLWTDGLSEAPAGIVSGLLGAVLTACLSKAGAVILLLFLLLLSVLAVIDIRPSELVLAFREEKPDTKEDVKESKERRLAKSYYSGKEAARKNRRETPPSDTEPLPEKRRSEFHLPDVDEDDLPDDGGDAVPASTKLPPMSSAPQTLSDSDLPEDEPEGERDTEKNPPVYEEPYKPIYSSSPSEVPLVPDFDEDPELLTDLFLRKEPIPKISEEGKALVAEAVHFGTAPLPKLKDMPEFQIPDYSAPASRSEQDDYSAVSLEDAQKTYRDDESIDFYENPEPLAPDDSVPSVVSTDHYEETAQVVPGLSSSESIPEEEPSDIPAHKSSAKPTPKRIKAVAKNAKQETEHQAANEQIHLEPEEPGYIYPPISLLELGSAAASGGSETDVNRSRLAASLRSFNIEPNFSQIVRGPTVTRYELTTEVGVKLSKITSLSDDIAYALGVDGVRISAVPDKNYVVGIEVPNRTVSTVRIRDVIEAPAFSGNKNTLAFAVGKDIGGNQIVGNIGKLPHLLIAGTTGSGKSVCVNSLITSLLYKASPDEVRLIMIDPKMVELQVYNGIPHLMLPVVTDPKKASGTLQWAVQEMLRRYSLMAERGTRDITGYNNAIKDNPERKQLPKLVIIIDELADLMMACAKDVEDSICRIAQMGRAAGVHLIVATQRPSANVITGLMKANIPSRIAFAVASAMESRIILDTPGAEKLVGKGDMLFAPLGEGKPKRVQGCFISDEEVERVTDFIKNNSAARYDAAVESEIERRAAANGKQGANFVSEPESTDVDDDRDELLYDAVDVILEMDQASVSVLQRKLKVGYARASRIVDQMEEIGIVGPHKGSKPRDILIDKAKWPDVKAGLMSIDDCIGH